ncbi:hypothetical protein [Paenibacillus eucommiae]|uniref:ABC transporter permease n=1 Tax=Paenibacillus eucommiae TaxID=1355755 RepID=A0ABS4J3A8_9BACL|nr:hypothetical protein [Paenibacillus eucommiae]MBP1994322.1 hypothetical protein [Paenibacillus eucommiae]
MTDLKTIWLCARVNFSKWPVTPRIYTLAAIIIAFSIWVFSWISDYASTVGVAVSPWVFPYLLTTPIMFPIYGCLTALLFCDAPFMDSHTPFLVIRTSRRNWVTGQLLYIVLAGFVYTTFFLLMSILVLIPNVQFSMDWGAVLKTIAFNPGSPAKYGITSLAVIGGPVMTLFSAIQATLISFGLFWLVTIFIGVLIFCFNIVIGRMSGLVAAGVFTVIAYFSIFVGKLAFGNVIYYVSPLNWSSMSYLDWGGTGSMPSPVYAVGCLLGAILLLSIISVFVFCKKDMHIQGRRY